MIRYTIVPCSLGRLLLAATERGICAVTLGATDKPLLQFLADEFPDAEFTRDERGLRAWSRAVVQHLAGERAVLDLPIDVPATPFQQRVWKELCNIPHGQTRSYRDIAERIGQPSAVRAVARACATNPVAVIVPCHRVIGSNGALTGYRWGIERKRALLAMEKTLM